MPRTLCLLRPGFKIARMIKSNIKLHPKPFAVKESFPQDIRTQTFSWSVSIVHFKLHTNVGLVCSKKTLIKNYSPFLQHSCLTQQGD